MIFESNILTVLLKRCRSGGASVTEIVAPGRSQTLSRNSSDLPSSHAVAYRNAAALQRDLPIRLQKFTRRFAERYAQTDLQFGELARALRHLYQTAQSLADMVSGRLETVRDALNASRISGDNGMAAESLRDLRAGLEEISAGLNLLHSVSADLRKLRMKIERIEQVGVFVHASVFGFAVESARSADRQGTFGAFVAELRVLAEKISSVAERIKDHSTQTQQAQAKESDAITVGHSELCELTRQLDVTAGTTAAAAQSLLDHSLADLNQTSDCMRRITQHADEAVYYLQFGDIVRQKTEHIAAALSDAGEQLKSAPDRNFRAQATAVDHTLAIQIGQLELIRTEVSSAHQKLSDSFRLLGSQTARLQEMLNGWRNRGVEETAKTDPFAAFKDDLSQLDRFRRRGHELRLSARRTAHHAIEASGLLAKHVDEVREINTDIHLKALNAIVKTAALGDEGSTLSVLSMHVDWLYRESSEVVAEIIQLLEGILQKARESAADEKLAENLFENSSTGMERIESAYDACRATALSAAELVGNQQAALANAQGLFGFLSQHIPDIDQQIMELTAFRQSLAPWVDAKLSAGNLASLQQRYTMASEREIHERMGVPESATAATHASAPAPDDNWEMFDSPSDAVSPVSQSRSEIQTATHQPVTVATPSAEPANLGDNVELF